MSDKQTAYTKARQTFEALAIGERVTARELAETIGVTAIQDRTAVAAFLSQQAKRGKVKKHVGEDKRTYYEKIAPPPKLAASKTEPAKKERDDTISLEELGESIVNHIERLKKKIGALEKERDQLREKLTVFSKQKEEFRKLYQEAEGKLKQLSAKQPTAQKTIRLANITGE